MLKRSSRLHLDDLSPAELEEYRFVLRTLVSKTFAKETDLGLRRSRRSDFDALVQRYSGALLTRGCVGTDDDDDDEDEKSNRRSQLVRVCQPALRQVEHALRGLPEELPLDGLCASLAKTLRLTPCQIALFRLALAIQRNADLRGLCRQIGSLDKEDAAFFCHELLEFDAIEIEMAFHEGSPILIDTAGGHDCLMQWIDFPGPIRRRIRSKLRTGETLVANDFLDALFCRAPAAKLQLADFPDPSGEIALLHRYLRQCLESPRAGVNLLLFGPPGTGKTQLARATCQALGAIAFEVPTEDDDQDPLCSQQRLAGFRAAQAQAQNAPPAVVVFDEFEDAFPVADDEFDALLSASHRRGRSRSMKGWVNKLLETHPVPAIWVGNSVQGLDEAYLRRFDMVIEVKRPRLDARRRMVEEFFGGQVLPEAAQRLLIQDARLAPAHLERMATVLQALAPESAVDKAQAVRVLRNQVVRCIQSPSDADPQEASIRYRPDCITADADLAQVMDGLRDVRAGRFCLYGPPGTGKSAWARHVADQVGRTLLVRRASDLLNPFVGGTEQRIRRAFDAAEREEAVLLIDEADSFLRDRGRARASWEVTQVNELLTAMERFEGIFIATTNLMDDLDEASLRRFDCKIRFGYLTATQCRQLLDEALAGLKAPVEVDPLTTQRLARLDRLTPGDFAMVVRQLRLRGGIPDAVTLVERLAAEMALKRKAEPRKVGFV